MLKKKIITVICFLFGTCMLYAQQPGNGRGGQPQGGNPTSELTKGLGFDESANSFLVEVNRMGDDKRKKIDEMASKFQSRNRSIISDWGQAAVTGGVAAVINVLGEEIINLFKIRSKQKAEWESMRQKECKFVDSLQSVKGQSDFYSKQSMHGFLDPTGMNFDGVTFTAFHKGEKVLRMVCHIDTTRLEHMFMHSKFYLVVDTVEFYPYRSYLPNFTANHIIAPNDTMFTKDEMDYWNTISHFSFDENMDPTINIRIDFSSSWISEIAQVHENVHLGTFNMSMPIRDKLKVDGNGDSVYVYVRNQVPDYERIEMSGDCFVVPRSYMPVDANTPSWGTGEYKIKVVLSESCRYDPQKGRATNWHKDYKQLVKLQNKGKSRNDYWQNFVSTFADNKFAILKATYTPVLTKMGNYIPWNNTMSSKGGVSGTSGTRGSAQGAAEKPM